MAIRISEAGYRSGLIAAASTVAYGIVQVAQVAGLLRFPADEILIYGSSLCIVVPFILEMTAFHHLATGDARYWTHAALIFSVIYAIFVTANYVVQLATVIPARLNGAGEPLRLLEQTPHSLFWDYDAIGYIAMGLATLVAIPALDPASAPAHRVRSAFIAHTIVTPLIAVVYFAPTFSTTLLILGFPWAITAPLFMWRLARLLRGQTALRGEVSA
jgi:heme/copper-type cytochrome/quinol oxidase subunit 4